MTVASREHPRRRSSPTWDGIHRPGPRGDAAPRRASRATSGRLGPAGRQAALRAEGQERHLAVHERRRQPHGESSTPSRAHEVRRQVDRRDAVRGRAEPREAEAGPSHSSSTTPTASSATSSIRSRSASGSTARAGSRSATGCRTSAAASTTSPSSARCTRPTTTTAPRRSSTPAGTCSTASSPRSAPGSTTASGRSTTTCRSSSRWATASTGTRRTATTSARPTTRCRSASTRATRSTSASPRADVAPDEQQIGFDLVGRLNRLKARRVSRRPGAARRGSRPTSWPSGCRRRCPRCSTSDAETDETKDLYGLDDPATPRLRHAAARGPPAGRARRAVHPGPARRPAAPGVWDAHGGLKANHERNFMAVDKPIAGLLEGPEAARAARRDDRRVRHRVRPHARLAGADGRDHHIYGFSVWMAGGGIKGGVVHGATDEIGFHAVEDRHYVTDIHATILNNSASTPAGSRSRAASGWTSTTGTRSRRSSRDDRDNVASARIPRSWKAARGKSVAASLDSVIAA